MEKRQYVLIGVLVVFTFLLFLVLGSYNTLKTSKANVENSLKTMDSFLIRRIQNAEAIDVVLKPLLPNQKELFDNLKSATEAVKNTTDVEGRSTANTEMGSIIRKIFTIGAGVPSVSANASFKSVWQEYVDANALLSKAANDYNRYVEAYNKELSKFPSNIVAKIMKYKKAATFDNAEGNVYYKQGEEKRQGAY